MTRGVLASRVHDTVGVRPRHGTRHGRPGDRGRPPWSRAAWLFLAPALAIIVALLALYPTLRANDVVGTDLIQAVPLVSAAALGHAFFGDLHLDLAAAVLIGSVPGVLIGSRISSRAPAGLVRAALVTVAKARPANDQA